LKYLKFVAIGLILLLTTSCVKLDLDLQINSDSTVSGSMIFAVSDSLEELSDGASTESSAEDLFDTKAKGVTTEAYDEGGFVGQKFIFDRVPASAFSNSDGKSGLNSDGKSGELTISREGDLITLNGNLDLSMDSSDSEQTSDAGIFGEALGLAFTKTIFSSAELRIRVKFPSEVVSTTGKLSADKRTVTWEPKIGDKVDFKTTVRVPGIKVILYAGIGLLGLLLIGGIIYFMRRKRSPAELVE